ncbi:hypothetical protein GGI23_005730, partial [Coemansia sp. RSA 2559]
VATNWVDSLSAFFPGLMVLAGDIEGAESAYLLYYHLWRRFRAMPERFNLNSREPNIAFYPLRPEFIESTYHLYRATGDKFYLDVGEMVLADLNSLQYVFTTEGHVLMPLSPTRNGSAQYPQHSSFARRKLIHSDRPPRKVKPSFYNIANIRRKLRSSSGGLRSPLEQLYAIQQLAHDIHNPPLDTSAEQRRQRIALHLNAVPATMPLRVDFYTSGLLVDNGDQQTSKLRGGAGTTSINSSLAAAMDYGGMCADPASLVLSQRQELWKANLLAGSFPHADKLGIQDPPSYAKTWLTPHTQQFSFMEFLFSRTTNRQVFGWNIPQRTRTRQGVPLLKEVWNESTGFSLNDEPRHGVSLGRNKDDGHEPARRIVVTNGAGQVMTDYVIVRATMDVSLQTLVKELQSHNADATSPRRRKKRESAMSALCNNTSALGLQAHGSVCSESKGLEEDDAHSVEIPMRAQDMHRRRSYVGRLAAFSELSLYRGDVPFLVPQPTTLVIDRVHRLPTDSGCTEYSSSARKLVQHKVVAVSSDGDCTVREKAVHAMNAGASALLTAETDNEYSHRHTRQHNSKMRPQKRHRKGAAEKQMHNQKQKQSSRENTHTGNGGSGWSRSISSACNAFGIFSDMCHAHASGREPYSTKAAADANGGAWQINMPVVIVSQGVLKELEGYMVAGLLVSVELL